MVTKASLLLEWRTRPSLDNQELQFKVATATLCLEVSVPSDSTEKA